MSKSIKEQQKLEEEKNTVEKITQKSIIKGRTTEEMMSKHVHDEKDVITEEDFKNLKIDFKLPTDEAHQPLTISSDPDRPKDEDKDPKIMTPWDVIS